MAGRGIGDIVDLILEALPSKATQKEVSTARKAVEKAASPASKIPKPGTQVTVPGLPPTRVQKEKLDPMGYSGTKLTRPIEAYTPTLQQTNTPNLPRKTVTMEDLEGGLILPLYGDRSAAGGLLTRVGDIDLQRAYEVEGGVDFMRALANQVDDAVWASAPHITKRLVDAARTAAEASGGAPIYGTTISMAPDALDFASFTPRVAADLAQQYMTKGSAKKFDDLLRQNPDMKDWPGVMSPDLDQWLLNAETKQRKAFLRTLDKDKVRKDLNLPPDIVAAARYAVTDPTQRAMPSGYGGLGISRLDIDRPFVDAPQAPHSTYGSQMRGEYVGGLLAPVRQEDLLRDAFSYYLSPSYVDTKGAVGALSPANATYAAKTQLPLQRVDAQMVDHYMMMLEDMRSKGLID